MKRLQTLVLFARPDEWRELPESSQAPYPITFQKNRIRNSLHQAAFNGREIRIHIPDLLDLPLYGNRVIINGQGPAIIGGGYSCEKYQLPESEQLALRNFTEWLLAHIAHEIHHAYLHWLDPANYTNAKRPGAFQTAQEKECERYAAKIVRSWREQNGNRDLPFPRLKNIRKRVREENERINEEQRRRNELFDRLRKQQPPV